MSSRWKLTHEGYADAHAVIADAWAKGFALDPIETVSEWAERARILSGKSSSERGRWRNSRTPYLRDVMDALTRRSPYERVVFMKGTQIGATEAALNYLGYVIEDSPGPMLLVLPTVDVARRVSKQRIAPMLEDTPSLAGLVAEPRARDSGNTVFAKEFPAGMLMITGANSGAGLSSMPIQDLLLDEVDRYPGEVGEEGDPVGLAIARTETFHRRKIFLTSSPTTRGQSRIEKAFLETDQRRYFVPCPHCGHYDWLQWTVGGWTGKEGRHHHIVFENRDPSTARLRCASCDEPIEERWKLQMLERGEWRATAEPIDPRSIGFHLSALYSPLGWKSWAQCVIQFLAAREDRSQLRVFVNTVLGETWEEPNTSIEPGDLLARLETYPADVPHGSGILVAGVDVQDTWLEVLVHGFGAEEECWPILRTRIDGDPGQYGHPGSSVANVWRELDDLLQERFTHESGQKMPIEAVAIDTGGHHSDDVYKFCQSRFHRRIYAVRGGGLIGKPLVSKPTRNNRFRVPLYTLCVDAGKDTIASRLQIQRPGPGFIHMPASVVDEDYVAQLTAEKAIRKWTRGRGSERRWENPLKRRNEVLDCSVYALAALHILGPMLIRSLGERAARWSAAPGSPAAAGGALAVGGGDLESAPATPSARPRPLRGGWVDGWRR